jgi:hypothetical protein
MNIRRNRSTDHFFRLLCVPASLLIAGALTACVSSHVLVGHPRSPISPEQVQVYLQPPARYEEIAIVDSSSRGTLAFSSQAKSDKVVDRLKKEAASLGANGILLRDIGDQSSGSVGTGIATTSGHHTVVGTGISGNVFVKSGKAVAIYVPPDAVGNH